MSYREALDWLYRTQTLGIKLGLDNIERLLRALGLSDLLVQSQRTSPSSLFPRVLHVAGTNGKGSVCAMAESILRASGYRTALFTSPHLLSFRERIRVNGETIPEEAVAHGLTTICELVRDWDTHPTFFEITTALALQYFKKKPCEIIVLETGMGGRLDATNAVQSDVCVITSIALDHQKWLGQTITEIAAEKAGIIKTRTPVFSAPQVPDAEKVFRERAAACDASLTFVTEPWRTSRLALVGEHQEMNAALAVAAAKAIAPDLSDEAIGLGLETVAWPARFQIMSGGRIIIDGAHNPAGMKMLAQTWRQKFGNERATIILAILADKNTFVMIDELRPLAARFILPRIKSVRAIPPAELARQIEHAVVATNVSAAVSAAQKFPERILLAGSLHFAGEALAHLDGQPSAYEECTQ